MSDTAEDPRAPSARRRRWLWPLLAGVALCVLLPALTWLRLYLAPLHLPDGMQARIEARIDNAMVASDIEIGEMLLALPEGGRAPALEFRDVALTAPDGELRAILPALQIRLAPGPLVSGQMRIKRVVIRGAGLNLRRDADGRIDLDFAGEQDAADLSLADTMARLDQMFDNPIFANLEEVSGEDLEVTLSDFTSGRAMRLHGAEMRLVRDSGQLSLDVGGQIEGRRNARIEIAMVRGATGGVTDLSLDFDTLSARDVATLSPNLAFLNLIRAPVDGAMSARLADDGTIGQVSAWAILGAGELALPGREAPLSFSRIAADLDYDPETRRARFDRIALQAEQAAFEAGGHADISADGALVTAQLAFSEVMADPEGLFDAPLVFDGAALDLRLSLGETVELEIGQAVIFDGDMRAMLSGDIRFGSDGLNLALDAHIPQSDVATVLSYWPETAIPNTRWWVADRLRQANVAGVDFAFRKAPAAAPNYELSFDFSGAEIQALPAAPPIRSASGFLNLLNQRLLVGLDGGGIAAEGRRPIALAGSRMVIEDVSVRGPLATFDLDLAGALPDLMHLLDGPPFAVLADSDFGPDEIGDGRITGEVNLSTRLLNRPPAEGMAGLEVWADAVVTDFVATDLVPERRLTGDRILVTLTPDQLSVGGQAALDEVPLTGQWSVLLAPDAPPGSVVEARATLDRDSLARFGVTLPDWLVSGAAPADLRVALQAGQPAQLNVQSDLDGLGLAIPALAWRMAPAQTGRLSADITLGPRPEVTDLRIDGAGLALEGAVNFTDNGTLNRLSAARFQLGQWLDVRGGLIGRGADTPAIEVIDGTLDFRTMPSLAGTGGASNGSVGPLDIALDRLQITEGIALTGLRAALDGASMSGEFRGSVNGEAPVAGQLIPGPNGPSVRLISNDGGAVMRAAGIFENMYQGQMSLLLAALPDRGQYDGRLTVTNPRLRDAPVMAELLNVISVVGLLEQLSGEGINMGEVDAQFRITPERIVLTEGAAVGPSMGISMDGVYDVATARYEMQGVVSPLYLVNGVFGALFAPRREGLFGFNYRLIGAGDQTQVTVNPLSILTPGIFREIFRAPPPNFEGGASAGDG
ncbi:hypothetical protein V8J82_15945 [Gymnodinialimonas sp. 2305UL16-5]|uniref:YhdP family protein n=1 Tax=Gymnodinialimonas mytili TaxID=3126503 RepID=UPI0030AEEA07